MEYDGHQSLAWIGPVLVTIMTSKSGFNADSVVTNELGTEMTFKVVSHNFLYLGRCDVTTYLGR